MASSRRFTCLIELILYRFLFSIIEIARTNPELIHFLDKFDDLKSRRNELHYVGSTCVSLITAKDVETQTDTHPIPSNVDMTYHWNIWDLRRKAISLANLMNCQTNSSQTSISYGNFNANTQTYSSKVEETQTRCNSSTDMPKPTTLNSYIRDIDFGSMSDEMQCLNLINDLEGKCDGARTVTDDERTFSNELLQ